MTDNFSETEQVPPSPPDLAQIASNVPPPPAGFGGDISAPVAAPPGKWLGPKGGLWMSLGGAALLVVMLITGALLHRTGKDVPTQPVILGAVLVAGGILYTMAYRLKPSDQLSVARLLGAVGVAAFLTTFLAGAANSSIASLASESGSLPTLGTTGFGIVSTLFAGPVEEALKLITVLVLGMRLPVKNFRTGMFIGGAVGLGFAAMENVQYIAQFWEHPNFGLPQFGSLTVAVILRSVITPLLHPILTSLSGGALFAATASGRYRLSGPFVGIFLAVVGIHSLWDTIPIGILSLRGHASFAVIGSLGLLGFVLILGIAVAMPLIWRIFARGANESAGIAPSPRT